MSDPLRDALSEALEIVALTDDRAKQLVAPAFKEILSLRDEGVDESKVQRLLQTLRECCQYHRSLSAVSLSLAGRLDSLTYAQRDELRASLSIKGTAKALRPALKVLAAPHRYEAADYVRAVRTVDQVAALIPRERLLSGSMAHELRGRAYGALAEHLHRDPDVVGVAGATIAGHPHPDAVAVA